MWALLTPFVFRYVSRFPLTKRIQGRRALWHLLGAGLTSSIQMTVVVCLVALSEWVVDRAARLVTPREMLFMLSTNLVIYAVLLSIHYLISTRREQRLREEQMAERLARSELQNLRMQLQPHFLFNTLHAIGVLMMRDAQTARRMLVRLSELLRLTLDHQAAQEVTLRQELEFLAAYLEIERTRFQDKLTVQMEIEAATLEAAVPSLLLQPLVENAIRHGVARRAEAGLVVIRATQQNGCLQLEVRDNGPGMRTEIQPGIGPGIGLATTQARLEQLYRAAQQFEIADAAEGGLRVTVRIPWRRCNED